jgi:hypothetical protein
MIFLNLKWRIQIVMMLMMFGLLAFVLNVPDWLPFPLNETTLGLMVGLAFLASIGIGIAWDWYSEDADG